MTVHDVFALEITLKTSAALMRKLREDVNTRIAKKRNDNC